MADSPYFDQIDQNINGLLAEERYEAAYSLINDYIAKHPDEKKLVKLRQKIELEVEEKNQEVIKEKLEKVETLWKEEKYDQILQDLKRLLELSPGNSKITKLYQKAQEKYEKQVEERGEEFEKAQEKRLKGLLETNPDELIDELYRLEANNPNNKKVGLMVKKFRTALITQKIKSKQELLKSDKYEDIRNFVLALQKIDPESEEVQQLEQIIKQKVAESRKEQESEFIYKGEENLDTLMKLKKYDKASLMAVQILRFNPNDKYAKKTLKKAERKFFKQTRDIAVGKINKNLPALKKEYKADKAKFVRV